MTTYIVMHEGRHEVGGRSWNVEDTVEADGFKITDSELHFFNGIAGGQFVKIYAAGKWISVRRGDQTLLSRPTLPDRPLPRPHQPIKPSEVTQQHREPPQQGNQEQYAANKS